VAKADGTACDDGDLCTQGDSCQAGACTGGPRATIAEYPTGLTQPQSIVPGPDGQLWFVSPHTRPGGFDGSVARMDPATGGVTPYAAARELHTIVTGSDGNLWLGETLPNAFGGLWALGRITPAGAFLPDITGIPADGLAISPDGDIWFTSSLSSIDVVGRITPTDALITALTTLASPAHGITTGPDGHMWIVESNGAAGPARIARVTLDGALTEFPVSTPGDLNGIAAGPDGNLWFTDAGRNEIGRITPAGAITKFAIPTAASGPFGITAGSDGNLWFTERAAGRLGWVTPDGHVGELACIPTANSGPSSITAGSDGGVWFTEADAGNIGSVRLPLALSH
jgi:virginiamycin B lyase